MAYSDMLRAENMEAAIWEAILAIRAQAVELAPVDTGGLKNSISAATNKREYGFNKEPGANAPPDAQITKPDNDMVGVVGTAIEYGAAVEFGRPDMPNYPAQPYLRPAAALLRGRLAGIAKRELMAKISEMAEKKYPFRK